MRWHEERSRFGANVAERRPMQRELIALAEEGRVCLTGLVTTSQMRKGFDRMQDYVEDLELDVPGAIGRFKELEQQAKSQGLLSELVYEQEESSDKHRSAPMAIPSS
ncbi:hypothetical protein CYMTET_22023 [Cymbomonas tetramitiformis]|uniref:MI domain-containing protein n=1 Tax=Cymbomonas tetramitiformis TaxID=36881 RepID=A0AAE0L2Q0_9CHLO|nr:hypothetical protein CYMTET_22023 [Cymbomonas tetramitiformis]